MTITDINELKNTIDHLAGLRATKADLARVSAEVQAQIDEQEAIIQKTLEAVGLDRFEGTDVKVSLVEKNSVKMPQDEANRALFLHWLNTHGMANLLVVNSQTLNSLYNREQESALAKGIVDFRIPGIDGVKTYTTLSVRKK